MRPHTYVLDARWAASRIDGSQPLPYKPRKIECRPEKSRVCWFFEDGVLFPRRDQRRTEREADLSTEQARTQASSRFPRAHGDEGGTQGPVGAPGTRTQAAVRLTAVNTAARIASMERLTQPPDLLAPPTRL